MSERSASGEKSRNPLLLLTKDELEKSVAIEWSTERLSNHGSTKNRRWLRFSRWQSEKTKEDDEKHIHVYEAVQRAESFVRRSKREGSLLALIWLAFEFEEKLGEKFMSMGRRPCTRSSKFIQSLRVLLHTYTQT